MALRYADLTVKKLSALHPGEQIQENGIIAKRLRNGDLHWSINTMVDGIRIHRVIGTDSAGTSRDQAERAIESLRTRAREERLTLPRGRKTYQTLAIAGAEYLDRMRREGGKNLTIKTAHFRNHLFPKLGSLPINRISVERLTRYRTQRRAEGVQDSTVNRELRTLSHFLRKAASWKCMSADDVPTFPLTPEPKIPFKVLSADELEELYKAAAKQGSQALLFLQMMAGTTMRPAEVLKARFESIVDDRDELYIPQAKSGDRVQPITTELAHILRRRRKLNLQQRGTDVGWMFPSPFKKARNGKPRTSYLPMFRRCVALAGLDPTRITPYTVRRTSITNVAATGIDIDGLLKISGHKSMRAVLRYIHSRDETIRASMKALERKAQRAKVNRGRATPLHQNCTAADKAEPSAQFSFDY